MANEWIEGFKCPNCGNETLTYNGNYFCTYFECIWVNDEVDLKITQQSDFILNLMLAYMIQTLNPVNPQPNYQTSMDSVRNELARRKTP